MRTSGSYLREREREREEKGEEIRHFNKIIAWYCFSISRARALAFIRLADYSIGETTTATNFHCQERRENGGPRGAINDHVLVLIGLGTSSFFVWKRFLRRCLYFA